MQAARAQFAADGFERTTIRAVAADADIDPSMVMRYYGSKRGLFAAATHVDLELPDLAGVPAGELGAATVRHFLSRWDGADDSLRILLASAATNATAAQRMQEIFRAQLQPVVAAAGPHDPGTAAVRAGLVASQMLGLALCRYVLRLPPVVDLEPEAIVRWLSPVVQRYLKDPEPDGRPERR
ncbi:MAG: TetR family transcriptional regulator [Solirubrobacteraceae bacterium]